MGEHARPRKPAWPAREISGPQGEPTGGMAYSPEWAATQAGAAEIARPEPLTAPTAYADAVSTYNREQSFAFGRYRADCDQAWLAYLAAVHQAEIAYEEDVTALGNAFEVAMGEEKASAPKG